MAAAPKGICAGSVGIGVYHRFRRDDTYHRSPWHDPQLLVDHCRQRAFGCRLWDPVVGSAKVRGQERPHPAGAGRGLALDSRLLDRADLCAAGSPGDGDGGNRNCLHLARRLRTLARTRRRRVALACHRLLLAHAAAIPIHIPLAGALTHPDPSDVDLLTFAIFEGAFVCMCTAYLFGGLAKDRIATRYRRASLTDPLTGVVLTQAIWVATVVVTQPGSRLSMATVQRTDA
jgi:hypothetical protein